MIRVLNKIKLRRKNIILVFIGRFVKCGKRFFILKIFVRCLFKVKLRFKKSFIYILVFILNKLKPVLGIRPLFASGKVYMLPYYISKEKEKSLGLNWFYNSIVLKKGFSFEKGLLEELLLCYINKGQALKYKLDFYRLIKNNRDLLYRYKRR